MKYNILLIIPIILSACSTTRGPNLDPFPNQPKTTVIVNETIQVKKGNEIRSGVLYKASKKLGDLNSQKEGQKPVIQFVTDGHKFKNLHVYGADGVHIDSSDNQLEIISYGGEDAITIRDGSNRNKITGSAHSRFKDKRIQINGGKDNLIYDYTSHGNNGKLAKLKGEFSNDEITAIFANCKAGKQYIAHVEGENATAFDAGGNESATKTFQTENGGKVKKIDLKLFNGK